MPLTRRRFIASTTAVTILPFVARADGHQADVFDTPRGPITVYPISHASFVMETPHGTIYVDPVGDASLYRQFTAADLVLVTHEHGDHYNPNTLFQSVTEATTILTNQAVYDKLGEDLKFLARPMANGGVDQFDALTIEAIPAYNTTPGRENFHPQGRDNGYIINFGEFRIYISGDTEDIPEMRSLENIDIAFVCMNLPFTMDATAAASAVNAFAPTYCYPYHYRGRDNGTQDPMEFAAMLNGVEAKMGGWYG